jgi:hypothetical protein
MGDAAIRNILISAAVMRAAGILVAHSKLGGRRRTMSYPDTIRLIAKSKQETAEIQTKLNACMPPPEGRMHWPLKVEVPGKRATWHLHNWKCRQGASPARWRSVC